MTVQELFNWLQDKPDNATLVDVREYAELKEQGVIKGYNQNIPWFLTNTDPDLFDQKCSTINKEEQVNIKQYIYIYIYFSSVYTKNKGINSLYL